MQLPSQEAATPSTSPERLRALVHSLPDLIIRQSIDGTYLDFVVSKAEELTASAESMRGVNIRELGLPPELTDTVLQSLKRAIEEGTVEVFEYELQVLRGLQHYESRIVRCGPNEAVCIIRNVTERKQAEKRLLAQEEELQRHRAHLEELVRQRTERLVQATRSLEERQAQLIQAEKMASLGQMAAGVAHEISSPVGYVLSNLGALNEYGAVLLPLLRLQQELLAASATGAPQEPVLERMRAQWEREDVKSILEDMPELLQESLVGARRIREIVQTLRLFAREDSREPQPADLNAELESTLKMVWNQLKYKCTVTRDFGTLPLLRCHPTQLAQVFTNLLINAAQAIETQGAITLSTRHEQNAIVVRISDTGKGMTPEVRARLFTPFFTTKPREQGTGLGLSVSYSIIASHQGHIDVQSEPGQGTTFTIRLPVLPE
ncbi:sensor histidine kinase [Stigmatella hybrida]|uniref:sensor histidine kinase n=1 Tax=Stigmatella hybrida TaxID=394097 RepID=UPI001CDA6798|nr:ATP-binding protein [Stigmatella hybrida]